jgi:hypothetical protein
MENKKPNNFREAALSHIPLDIQQKMLQATKVETAGMSFLEAIAKNTPSASPLPVAPAPVPQQEQLTTIVINNTALKVSTDPYKASLSMLLYLAATVWSKDRKVAKVLKAFNFSLQDANGQILYPPQKKAKK